ncbi:DNA-directed RNA polymerase I subunit [Penicillium macrosclerotiorum]|uniref:DNA-directed RNA polymerase I subunit n=1 Tax=Penicillium macrosclerotiorum TaxID=303699 RepID=UPI0025473B1C|nr:DNA-directed RNA polymerase I subunit [Penicillium macrosclerotiorum]KAJ5682591.1 DNA-directed RNA polymerase I subunit [Penicillium macrosclerotiorum]
MATFTRPIASSIAGVDFNVYSDQDIKKLSVKRIHNTPTLDSFNNPVPGGLYDPAMGAWGDHVCTTCRLNSWSCTGHAGHIELPVPVYNVTFFDHIYRLLRAQCVYCHRLQMSRTQVNLYTCKLRLLQYGLIDEVAIVDAMGAGKGSKSKSAKRQDDQSDDEEDDEESIMEKRTAFVNKSIRDVKKDGRLEGLMAGAKNPIAAETRRDLVKTFLKDINSNRKCNNCSGISPSYRKDRYNKIFRKALPEKAKLAMLHGGFQAPNTLVLLDQEKKSEPKENGVRANSVVSEVHGAEEEIRRGAAVTTQSSSQGMTTQEFVPSSEVYSAMRLLFQKDSEILQLVYNSRPVPKGVKVVSADMFFIKSLLVPPNKYRPAAAQGPGEIMEASQNTPFNNILKQCDLINQISKEIQNEEEKALSRARNYSDLLQAIVALQDFVNGLIDRERTSVTGSAIAQLPNGIKQMLEKKEGLFRKNMMGKRVNFAARSVISPDPNLETNEIGVPLVFAKKLTFPEPVTNHNFWELKEAVINGPDKYPGASAIENENGQVVNLKFKSLDERTALANQLLAPSSWRMKGTRNKKVYRHLTTGDYVLMNRQPTLHKPSIMGHKARVLPNERTIRMHYANCNTYNADFDGDEMNMHFPQNELAQAEARMLADADHQYLVATSGKPLRGLIQDHISMGTWFTCRDSFFDEEDYHQLLYSCLRPENSHIVSDRIQLVAPAFVKPKYLWTGKQVITTILKNIKPPQSAGITLQGKSSTPGDRWGKGNEEDNVIFDDGEYLCGILDKKQLGPTAGGLIDAVHEIYGHTIAGKLMSILGRLLTRFLNMRAFTCGIDDLRLTKEGDRIRKEKLATAPAMGREVALKYVTLDQTTVPDQDAELKRRLEDVLRDDDKQSGLDSVSNARSAKLSSEITSSCLPAGLAKPFPWNQMQSMTISGAKGSGVNANLISCNLGQQVLEGRRVPVMISGKTLPSFRAYDTHPMAGGYVCGRFLTGIKPQEYYFHAMAGREGLIDTAVKTSRSGYLQRCLIKGMEGLRAEYDSSVREASDGSIVQFLYGEDGLDITKQVHLKDFKFLAENYLSVSQQVQSNLFHTLAKEEVMEWHKSAMKSVRKTGKLDAMDPVLSRFHPGGHLGSTSEAFAHELKKYEDANPDKLFKDKKKNIEGKLTKKTFDALMNMKYLKSIIDPGEAVGIMAGQSVGEPSTQMTLNTFHLAGHSAKNVTLGIPRLREIVMTASATIMTPTMTLLLNEEISKEDSDKFAKAISKLSIAEVVDKIQIRERIGSGLGHAKAKIYDIEITFFPADEYTKEYAIQIKDVQNALQNKFIPRLVKLTKAELKKRNEEKTGKKASTAQPEIGVSVGRIAEGPSGPDRAAEPADDDNEDDEDDAKRSRGNQNRSNQVSYEGPDDDEQAIIQGQDVDSDDEEDESNESGKVTRDVTMSSDSEDDSDDEEVQEHKLREDDVKSKFAEITKFKFDSKKGGSCTIQLQYDIETPKLLLLPLVENAAHTAVIQSLPGIGSCVFVEGDELKGEPPSVMTDGVNLLAMRDYQDIIKPHSLYTNSIHDMLNLYGVEAARATIIREMDAVFKGHSISVDNRHLNLIGDVMTQSGGFKAFSRNGLVKDSTSPFARMSFETTVGALKDSVLERDFENLKGPSSRIVVGRSGTVGTGAFDVLAPVA